jgi:hypothetical protein
MFYENNIWYTTSNGGMSMIDMDISDGQITNMGGGRAVCRYNQVYESSTGVGICLNHGTEGEGRPRSGRQVEVYGNTYNCAAWCLTVDGGPSRGGTGMLFNNTANLQSQTEAAWFTFAAYRTTSYTAPWGSCNGSGPYDQNDGVVYASGTLTGASGGGGSPIIVGDNSKSWTASQWVPTGAPYSFYDVTQGFWIEIASNTSNSLTSAAETPGAYYTAGIGDSYNILRATICIDQPGRGQGSYISGATPSPTGWVGDVLDPIYQWGDTASGGIIAPAYTTDTGKLINNRDFYAQASGPQISATSPFNGTSGTGWGVTAYLPSTCTKGVAYWDRTNAWLDKCTATNTWTTNAYRPYTYPHPLTTGGTSGTLPSPPTNLGGAVK